ncbi:putative serine/threonine-protein kinase Cx32 chloroplastic [Prunus yedoensis var. nudiflora]|uniref:Putative serine/threonine-protein kinase Cx32 chloroplastic n=1 Tax=Prunus yedoensis var. nudiflora TaxID=2094558 RepID=A0A314Y579_PRUYE|nr:putative serine/threonine-protein kinase Cx32 chloroplastic [Prunus yedoensis var. nudiflora]
MGNSFASCLPQTPNNTEQLENNAESRANPLPPFTAPHRVDISTIPASASAQKAELDSPAPGASSSSAFAAGPSNTGGEDLAETPSVVVAPAYAPGASSSSAFAAGPSNTGGEDLAETPSVVVAPAYAPGASSSSAFAAGPSNTGGEDLTETPSVVVAPTYAPGASSSSPSVVVAGGTILEEGQQPNFHLFKEEDLSNTVIQFRILVLDHKETKELFDFRICKHWNGDVVLQGLLNRHTNLVPTKNHPINDLPSRITILQEADVKSEEAFQRWKEEQNWLKRLVHENVLHPLGYSRYDWASGFPGFTDTVSVVYPSMEQGSLRDILASNNVTLSWDNRISIAVQVARGLTFLHSVPMGFIPCFKDANILLDRDFNVKLSGFGLKSLGHKPKNILSQNPYLPPEYPVGRIANHWSPEGDVFSFGVMLLELMEGNKLKDSKDLNVTRDTLQYLEDNKSDPRKLKSKLEKWIDGKIKHEYTPDKVLQIARIIKKCLAVNPMERPTSSEILNEFE